MESEASLSHYNNMNVMSMYAQIGAYQEEGYVWLEELRQVLTANVDFACGYIREHFEGIAVQRPQGTYMLFVDCTDWCAAHGIALTGHPAKGYDIGLLVPFQLPGQDVVWRFVDVENDLTEADRQDL